MELIGMRENDGCRSSTAAPKIGFPWGSYRNGNIWQGYALLGRPPNFLSRIFAREREIKLAEAQARREVIQRGPPAGSGITSENWKLWHEYEYFVCPRSKCTCIAQDCRLGASCRLMHAIGLTGDGRPLPRKLRPACGARNRRGEPCAVKVVPGKCRCRFHGGLSTGPRTIEGKARIAAAQRLRWARRRTHKIGGSAESKDFTPRKANLPSSGK
jgi:hypothetical protein